MKPFLLFAFAFLLSFSSFFHVFSQGNYGEFNRNTIIHGKYGDEKTSSYLHEYPDYDLAIQHLLELLKTDSGNIKYIIDLAFTYFKSPYQKTLCIPYCEKAIKMGNSEDAAELYYPLGISYRMKGEYEKAIETLNLYLERIKFYDKYLPQDEILVLLSEVNREIGICKNALVLYENPPLKFIFNNLPYTYFINSAGKNINSIYDDYNPVFFDDNTMIFTSRRMGLFGENIGNDGRYFEDMYISTYSSRNWTQARPMEVNTKNNDAANSISKEKKTLYLVRDSWKRNIMVSGFVNEKWTKPKKIKKEKNSKVWETCMGVAMYDTVVYFVNNIKGGFGGKDIYKSVKSADGSWSDPINLGPSINSPYQEESPFLSPDGKYLYFASNGHNTIGGYDIFRSKFINNSWSAPENLLSPINSENNELYFSITKEGQTAYLSSQRIKGTGRNDMNIYQITFKPEFETAKYSMLTQDKCGCGLDTLQPQYIYDDAPGTIVLKGVEVEYYYEDGKIILGDKMNSLGEFPLRALSPDNPYTIKLKCQGQSAMEYEKILCQHGQIQVRGPGGAMYTMVADENCVFRLKEIKSKFILSSLEKDSIRGLTIQVLDEDGKLICEEQTDENGEFCYRFKPHHKLYSLKLITDKPLAFKDAEIMVAGAGKKFYRFIPDENAIFRSEELTKDVRIKSFHLFSMLNKDTSYVDINGNIYYNNDINKPAKNIGILLKDENKAIYKRTITDSLGAFFFEKIPSDRQYSIMMDETSPDFNSNMKYLILGNIEIYGQKIPAEKFKLYLDGRYDENLITMVTDKRGHFRIGYLPADYYPPLAKLEDKDDGIFMDPTSTLPKGEGVSTAGANSKIVPPTGGEGLGGASLLVILFGYDKNSIETPYLEKLDVLCANCLKDTLLKIEITGHTDSNGNDDYNLKLSKRRAEIIASYMVSKGIKRKRIKVKAAGETQPAAPNRFPDGTDNPNGRKENRRAEVSIKK